MTIGETISSFSKNWRSILLLAAIITGTAGVLFGAYYLGLFSRHVPASTHFTVIESNQGFNDSQTHNAPWPVMDVILGQSVTILIENNDTVATHGFVIAHYFDVGVQLRPGESHNVTFIANKTGSFLVSCNIFCPVHPSMQYGQLTVNT